MPRSATRDKQHLESPHDPRTEVVHAGVLATGELGVTEVQIGGFYAPTLNGAPTEGELRLEQDRRAEIKLIVGLLIFSVGPVLDRNAERGLDVDAPTEVKPPRQPAGSEIHPLRWYSQIPERKDGYRPTG